MDATRPAGGAAFAPPPLFSGVSLAFLAAEEHQQIHSQTQVRRLGVALTKKRNQTEPNLKHFGEMQARDSPERVGNATLEGGKTSVALPRIVDAHRVERPFLKQLIAGTPPCRHFGGGVWRFMKRVIGDVKRQEERAIMKSSSEAREQRSVEISALIVISGAFFFDIAGVFGVPFATLAMSLATACAIGLCRRQPI